MVSALSPEDIEKLQIVFSDVIEKFSFAFVEPFDKEELPPPESECFQVDMSFSGEPCGVISVAMPGDLCCEIAVNVLALESAESCTEQQLKDALKELLNLTCGHVLTTIYGDKPVFNLSIPVVGEMNISAWNAFKDDPTSLAFIVDDRPTLFRFTAG